MLENYPKDPHNLIEKLRISTTGIDVQFKLANGETSRRIYLGSTTSTLQLGVVKDVMDKYLPYYANTRTNANFNAKLPFQEFDWAHRMMLEFVDADPEIYVSFFVGSFFLPPR